MTPSDLTFRLLVVFFPGEKRGHILLSSSPLFHLPSRAGEG
jgi:hypothetical protein